MNNERLNTEVKGWLNRKGIISEQRELMKEHVEEIDAIMAREGLDIYVFGNEVTGETVRVTRKKVDKEKLDKAGLAIELDVERRDLNTAGMVRLAEDRVLKEQHIIAHTVKEQKSVIKIKSRKPKK